MNPISYELAEYKHREIVSQLTDITNRITQSPPEFISITNGAFSGVRVGIIRTGTEYTIWPDTGTLTTQFTFQGGNTYYLLTPSLFQPIGYYQGGTSTDGIWLVAGTSGVWTQLFSDSSGIYIQPANNYPNITSIGFRMSLNLSPSG